MPHLNKNPTSQKGGFDSLSMEDKEIIRSHHRADCRLYEYALAKFSEKSV